jgi:hypothetical protein
MTGSRNGRLYQVDPISRSIPFSVLGSANLFLSTAESHLWHKRLAHLNHVSMKSLVDGYVPTDICEVCIHAKHERKIIRVPVLRTIPFELVHSDTCGPFTTKSHGGGLHFIVFIDDYTRHTTVHILLDKRAESCISAFQSFKARIESWGYTIKRFRCDNRRGEYDNTLFRRILAGSEKARAMMLDSQAPKQFWAEAIRTASYLHTRTPSRALDGKSPYEMLHRHRRLQKRITDVVPEADDDQAEDDKPTKVWMSRLQTDSQGAKNRSQDGSSFQAMHDAGLRSRYHKDLENMGSRATKSCQLLRCRVR